MFGALNTIFKTEKVIELLTQNKSRFGIESSDIKEGEKACLSLFNPKENYTFTTNNIYSSSKNSALLGSNLKGKAIGIVNNNQLRTHL